MNRRKAIKNGIKIISNENKETLYNSYHNKLDFKVAEKVAENKITKNKEYLLVLPNLFKKNKSKEKEKDNKSIFN